MSLFERFTEQARLVVVLAQEEARRLQHNYIGTEHILLGLARENEGVATRILLDCDASAERLRHEVMRIIPPPGEQPPQAPPPRLTGLSGSASASPVVVGGCC